MCFVWWVALGLRLEPIPLLPLFLGSLTWGHCQRAAQGQHGLASLGRKCGPSGPSGAIRSRHINGTSSWLGRKAGCGKKAGSGGWIFESTVERVHGFWVLGTVRKFKTCWTSTAKAESESPRAWSKSLAYLVHQLQANTHLRAWMKNRYATSSKQLHAFS